MHPFDSIMNVGGITVVINKMAKVNAYMGMNLIDVSLGPGFGGSISLRNCFPRFSEVYELKTETAQIYSLF